MDKHIVSFSGGKDSTAMLMKMMENNIKIDEIIMCDTGKEFPEMYSHIAKVEKYINRPITILNADESFEYYMFDHIKTKGKNKGSKGYSWPDFRNRWCTSNLKQQLIKRYLRQYQKQGYSIIEYHGIAIDEPKRLEKNKGRNIIYPLVDFNMTEKQALDYCYNKGFTWNGLYENFDRVSCWCCPLKNLKELKTLYLKYPELWLQLKEMDKQSIKQFGRKFRSDYSIEELEIKFKGE